MPKTEVILTANIVGLGAESDQVKVAAGYARNYLLPQGLAIPLTGANKRRLEVLRQRRAEREAHEFQTMTELKQSLSKLLAIVHVKTGDDGKMFGAVTPGHIADELKRQFDISLDKKKIHVEHPIRNLGEHEVTLHLHTDVTGTLKIRVESTSPAANAAIAPPAPAAAPAPVEPGRPKGAPRTRRETQPAATAAPERPSAPQPKREDRRPGQPKAHPETKPAPRKAKAE
jgi:large subunit ribosomal protein L9